MRNFLMMSVVLIGTIGFIHTKYATASSIQHAGEVRNNTNGTCPISGNPEQHWRVEFWGHGGCSQYNDLRWIGALVGSGYWPDHNTYQLTKTWMTITGFCLSPTTACYQTYQTCNAYYFTATCAY